MAIHFNPAVTAGDESSAVAGATSAAITESRKPVASQASAPQDTTSLASSSDSVADLTKAALATGASRADRVASLKQAVSTNQYSLDPGKIADALTNSDV